jgi:1-phosphofructokinase family hexose kinase
MDEESAVILTAGLTPAWQQVLVFDAFTPGAVNRAREVHWCASGKALNAALALHRLGAPCRTLSPAGGAHGEAMRNDLARQSVAGRWIDTAAATRVCTTIVDLASHSATELVENARGMTSAEIDAFAAAYAEEAAAAKVVILIGSLCPGAPATFYRDLLAHTPGRAILDARGPELLAALEARPFLVKPNREELGRTLGCDLWRDADLFDALTAVHRRGAACVLVTDGKNPTYIRSAEGLFRIDPPAAEVVNPIGCGDCMAAGIAWALHQGQEPLEVLRYGAAAATAKLAELLPALQDPSRVAALAGTIQIIRIS